MRKSTIDTGEYQLVLDGGLQFLPKTVQESVADIVTDFTDECTSIENLGWCLSLVPTALMTDLGLSCSIDYWLNDGYITILLSPNAQQTIKQRSIN